MLRSVVTAAVLVCAVWAAFRTDLLGSIGAVRDLDPMLLLLALATTLAAVVNRGFLHHQSRSLHGVECSLPTEIRMSAASLALNKVVKSGGLAGLAFYLRRARIDGSPSAAVTRAFVVVGAAAYVALAGVAVVALFAVPRDELPVAGSLSDMAVGSVGAVALAVVLTIFVAGVLTSGGGHSTRRIATGASRIVVHAGLNKALGVLTLAAVLAAAGSPVGLEVAVLVYATALVGGALSIVPAGLGVVEASMVAVLTATGIDPSTALVAVLAFRLFDLWIPVLIGWALSRGMDLTSDDDIAAEPVIALELTGSPSPSPAVVTT